MFRVRPVSSPPCRQSPGTTAINSGDLCSFEDTGRGARFGRSRRSRYSRVSPCSRCLTRRGLPSNSVGVPFRSLLAFALRPGKANAPALRSCLLGHHCSRQRRWRRAAPDRRSFSGRRFPCAPPVGDADWPSLFHLSFRSVPFIFHGAGNWTSWRIAFCFNDDEGRSCFMLTSPSPNSPSGHLLWRK